MFPLIIYFFSGTAILSALFVITASKPTRALMALMVTMFSLSILYLLLGAEFVAVVHLIVYAGAVLVLFLFVIMLQGIGARDIPFRERFRPSFRFAAIFVGMLFLFGVFYLLLPFIPAQAPQAAPGSIEAIADALFRDYLAPFELTSLLLLLGIFAAVALAKEMSIAEATGEKK